MTRDDLEALRIPLIVLAVTTILAAALVFFSSGVVDNARKVLSERETQLRQARMRIQNAGEEKEMIARYLSRYQQLAQAGFVGDEQRINWLDSLRIANEDAGIFGVEYDISAQRPYAYAAEFNTGQLLLQESVMRLKFRLLHEEDLPRFFNALARGSGGFFTIDQCLVRRVKAGEAEKSLQFQPHLAAECELRWLTVRPAATAEKKG
jgi:type II secretory pathway pseudopilin PulG